MDGLFSFIPSESPSHHICSRHTFVPQLLAHSADYDKNYLRFSHSFERFIRYDIALNNIFKTRDVPAIPGVRVIVDLYQIPFRAVRQPEFQIVPLDLLKFYNFASPFVRTWRSAARCRTRPVQVSENRCFALQKIMKMLLKKQKHRALLHARHLT